MINVSDLHSMKNKFKTTQKSFSFEAFWNDKMLNWFFDEIFNWIYVIRTTTKIKVQSGLLNCAF